MNIERALVLSPRKSGTHLVQNLMVELGFGIYGESIPPEAGRAAFSLRERLQLAERHLDPDEFARLDVQGDTKGFVRQTDRLLKQLGWMWQIRLAARNIANAELIRPDADFVLKMRDDAWVRPFAHTPPRLAWIFHSIDIWRADPKFLNEWITNGEPRMVLNLRDPRDALVSMVNFFAGEDGLRFQRFPESAVFAPVMRAIPDLAGRLTYALRDPTIPLLTDFERAIGPAHHPEVCAVAYEDLVGPQGGGTRARQLAAVERVIAHMGRDADPGRVADGLYDRGSFTFHKGRIGAWREVFEPEHEKLFAARFGHLLEAFGYE